MTAPPRTRLWDPARYLDTPASIAAYLDAAFETADPALVAAALGDVARAKGMGALAKNTDLGRESLYKTLSIAGNPELDTLLRVVTALGLRLRPVPLKAAPGAKSAASRKRSVRPSRSRTR